MIIRQFDVDNWGYEYLDHDSKSHLAQSGFRTLHEAIVTARSIAPSVFYGTSSTGRESIIQELFPNKYEIIDHLKYHKDGIPPIYVDYNNQWLSMVNDRDRITSIMVRDASSHGAREERRLWLMFGFLGIISIVIAIVFKWLF
jgi:hypothetical protein